MSFEFARSFSLQFRASQIIMELNLTSESKLIMVRICQGHLFSILSVQIYYGTQSDNQLTSYCRLNLLRASVFNFQLHKILGDSIGHPSIKLLSFEFAQSICFEFRASPYITGVNRTSELKSYCRLNLLRASVFNFERLDILRASIGYPSKKLLSFEFDTSFRFTVGASRIWYELLFSISSVSKYQGTQSDIRGRSYCGLHLVRASVFNSRISIYYGTQSPIRVKS